VELRFRASLAVGARLPVEMGVEGQSLSAEDQLFILAQAALYLTVTRGFAAARICYERVESFCHLP
jgi:hypothetical protein